MLTSELKALLGNRPKLIEMVGDFLVKLSRKDSCYEIEELLNCTTENIVRYTNRYVPSQLRNRIISRMCNFIVSFQRRFLDDKLRTIRPDKSILGFQTWLTKKILKNIK